MLYLLCIKSVTVQLAKHSDVIFHKAYAHTTSNRVLISKFLMRIHFGSFFISGYGQIYSCFILWEFCWKYSCDQFICIEFHFFLLYLRMIFHNFRTPKAFDDDFDIFWISWYVFVLYPFEALTGNFRILWICCHSVAHTQIDLFSPRGVFMSIFHAKRAKWTEPNVPDRLESHYFESTNRMI